MTSNSNSMAAMSTRISYVYVAAALTVIAFLATVVLVVDRAGRVADRFAVVTEANMVRLAADHELDLVNNLVADLSYWDDTVRKMVKSGSPDTEFVEDELVVSMIEDHGFSTVAVIKPDNLASVVTTRSDTIYGVSDLALVRDNEDLLDVVRAKYLENRVKTRRGFMVPVRSGERNPPVSVAVYRMVGSVPSIITAQMIVPDSQAYALKENEQAIMLAVKPLSAPMMAGLGQRLGLEKLDIRPAGMDGNAELPVSTMKLPDIGDHAALAFEWHSRPPWPVVIAETAPFAAFLCLMFCLSLAFIVFRHGSAVKSLSKSEAENRFLANHDALTRLANRGFFDRSLETAIANSKPREFAVMCIDLDKFKAVNDTHGHHAGDAVLVEVARKFSERVGDTGVVARVGGDEFIALIHDANDRDAIHWMAEKLIEDASTPIPYNGVFLKIGASVGVSFYPHDGESAKEIVNAADEALYASKRGGRGRATIRNMDVQQTEEQGERRVKKGGLARAS
ncbi:MAG: diguanylate cyclase [Nitratireductor sp.]|nr:diguanylate cyclase [Nitratireductor sp.]